MPKFNPLDHPICFASPTDLVPTAWTAYVPFAMTLVDLLRPGVIVELGTLDGVSYSAFCQAVRELKLDARCYAVTGFGQSEDNGSHGAKIIETWKGHAELYGSFSQLIQRPIDDAIALFQDRTIDLLHINGNRSYESVKHQFEAWLPKMSNQGVVLLHQINSHESDIGIWKLWEELKVKYPHFELRHERGLGLISLGAAPPNEFRQLLEIPEPDASLVSEFFREQGQRLMHAAVLAAKPKDVDNGGNLLNAVSTELQATQRALETTERALDTTFTELIAKTTQLDAMLNSRAWRWVNRYGRVKNRIEPAWRAFSRLKRKKSQLANYEDWVKKYDLLTTADRQAIMIRISALEYQPLISVVMPVYNVRRKWLRRAIESVRRQLYPNWELCIADDCSPAPHVRKILEEYAAKDRRIKITFREQNGHISAASNSALELASGEFVALLDHDDELPEHALYLIAEELNSHPDADLIYSDEDKIDGRGRRYDPHFKTDWNPDLLYSMNFVSHLGVYRTSILRKIGGFREGYEGSQDYDLALRFVEQVPANHVRHIPHILYHWRAVPGSVAFKADQKEYAYEAARKAIRSHFERLGKTATVSSRYHYYNCVSYPLPSPLPLVSLVITTRDRADLLREVVAGILELTDYDPVELLIVDNQSSDPEALALFREIEKDCRVRVIQYDAPFNFSAINNLAVRLAQGEIVGLVNNDIRIISQKWLKEMVRHALRPEIGAVGAKLYYADETVQHAGIIAGLGGVAGHPHKHLPKNSPGYFCRAQVIQNFSAVTGACLVMRRRVFDEVGGLDEVNLSVAFNDVDFCLRLRELGYRILWTPYAELCHLESASRGRDDIPIQEDRFKREIAYMSKRWGDRLFSDPYYNPNLSLETSDFSLAFPPRAAKLWKQRKSWVK
jgi:glycosyltransferase involved in cell wall biosynthesis